MKIFIDFHGREYTVLRSVSGRYYAGRKNKSRNYSGKICQAHIYDDPQQAEKELEAHAKKKGWPAK
jgi:hypothetical protein